LWNGKADHLVAGSVPMTDVLARLAACLVDRYEVQGELGAGGMATVYRAVDLKHQRDVAIKVLHPDLGAALGSERFLSEIRTTARLQHPHVLPLLDSGEADGLLYYVMPLVTGETLRHRLERERQLPIGDAISIAREVADALGYAHGLGVIHRDVKPENILLRDGHALVADFGIALAVQSAGGARMTQTGLSLGTPQYMSPEQAMGERTIDARSDLYSLGAVTYEMLAGEPPFTGPNVQAIVARLLSEEPRSLTVQRRAVPAGVEHAVMRALEKLPADRYSRAAEFAAALLADAPASVRAGGRARRSPSSGIWPVAAVGVAMLAAGVGVGRVLAKPAAVTEPARQLAIGLPDSIRVAFRGSVDAPGGQGSVTISGDGRRIAWVGTTPRATEDDVQLYVRDLSSYTIRAVPGTAGAFAPFLSSDGSLLGYFSGRELRETNLTNGETRVLLRNLSLPSGAAYLVNGSVLVTVETGMLTVVDRGGGVRRVKVSAPTSTDQDSTGVLTFPEAVPGNRFAVGLSRGGPMVVASLSDGTVRRIRSFAATDSTAGFAGGAPRAVGGRLYWLASDVVLSAAFDAEGARLTSEPVPVVSGVRGDLFGAADFDVADDGTVVFVAGADPSIGHLAWLDPKGRVDTLGLPPANYAGFDVSPDGRSLLTKSIGSGGTTELRVFDIARGTSTVFNVGSGDISQPGWSADGRSALVSVAPQGLASARVLRVPVDGRSAIDTIMPGGLDRYAVSRDGRVTILQVSTTRSPNRYLSIGQGAKLYASTSDGPFEELTTLGDFVVPALSPDGKWLAYEKYGLGQSSAVYIERFPLDGRPIQVSTDGSAFEAFFSAKGDKLFYRAGRGVMQVPLSVTGDRMTLGDPTMYVDFAFADFLGRGYELGNDDRLLVKLLPSTAPQSEIRVMTGGR
jgi:eukaryotic-like serine/threonine-protein kinase